MKLFKIRSKDGTYSEGGSYPRFGRVGKIWKRISDLSSHFTQLSSVGRDTYTQHQAEVVEIEMVATNAIPVADFIQAAADRKAIRQAEWEARRVNYREQEERRQLAALLAKYGDKK